VFDPPVTSNLVVTRRVIRACGLFDEGNRLTPQPVSSSTPAEPQLVSNEENITVGFPEVVIARRAPSPGAAKTAITNQRNAFQRRVLDSMLSGFTAANYTPRPLRETATFAALARIAMSRRSIQLTAQTAPNLFTKEELRFLAEKELGDTSQLFATEERYFSSAEFRLVKEIRRKVEAHVARPSRSTNTW
jgi:hypothetical protein